ncbi:MAG: hypothetical protein WCF17_14675 [Terracidiphilus sp.]
MECPYCKDTIPDAAWVCKTCRRDLQLVSSLQQQLAQAQSDLQTARTAPAPANPPQPRQVLQTPVEVPRRTEAVAVLAAAAMFPAVAYHLRSILDLPPKAATVAVVLAAGAAGLVIGVRHAHRVWVWFAAALLLAVLQVGAFCIAFGGSAHNYSAGRDSGIKIGAKKPDRPEKPASAQAPAAATAGSESAAGFVQHALRNRFLWLYQAIPSACLFIILAFIGRTYANRKKHAGRRTIGASLARRVTSQRPQEATTSFQQRLDGYSKIFDSLTHIVIVLLSIATSYYAIARTNAAPPDTATAVQQVAQK